MPADLHSLKELIASLSSEENVAKFATHVRYDRWVHRKMVEALGDHDRHKDFQFRGELILSVPYFVFFAAPKKAFTLIIKTPLVTF